MFRRHFTKLMSVMITIVMIAGFVMSSTVDVKAESTATTTITLLTGQQINEALKGLAGDVLPTDQSITSLYLVNDAVITGIERADKLDTTLPQVNLTEDGSAVAWLDGTTVKWYTEASTIYLNKDSSYMFYGMNHLTAVNDLQSFNASRVEDMSYLFTSDTSIVSLDITSLDTASVKNMKAMFSNMTALSSLTINNQVTAEVADMTEMFKNDTALQTLDLSSFKVKKDEADTKETNEATIVTDMFTGSSLSKIFVSYDWAQDITSDQRFIRVFPAWVNQTLVMSSETELKDITFTYSLEAGSAMAASSTTNEIHSGLLNENCVIGSAAFTAKDPISSGTPSDSSFEGKKYMSKKVKILIAADQFTEPGIYRYTVNENTSLEGVNKGLFELDASKQRVLDLLVEYPDNQNLKVTASVFHKNQTELMGIKLDVNEKSTGFDNSYLLTTNDLVIHNAVSGNQGDERRQYNYIFKLDKDIADRQLTVVHSDGSVESITIDENGHGELSFSLTGNERITIKDIQKKAMYTVTSEKEALSQIGFDIYVSSTNAGASYSPAVCYALETETSCYMTNLSVDEDVDITFLNVKNGVVPTGIILDTAPYTLSMVMGIVGIALIQKKKKMDKLDEESDC